MLMGDLLVTLRWWLGWVVVSWLAWPWCQKIFKDWEDKGYFFSKIIGVAGLTLIVWWLGSWHILPFTWWTILIVLLASLLAGWRMVNEGSPKLTKKIILEEAGFLMLLIFWIWIKAHEPTINGLEKFMDYGFTESILKGKWFPPADMWFAGESINYYYFGHLTLAVMTRLSGLTLGYTFNLILATLFALTATGSFAIARHLLKDLNGKLKITGAIFSAFIVTLGGNLQTIYAFTKGYFGEEAPPPFWTIWSDPLSWQSIVTGWRNYWYPNATRFIPYTIHEFPSYSFVVSDIHGHVLGIPWALLGMALLITWATTRSRPLWWEAVLFGVVTGLMFMTNTLDGPIYLGLYGLVLMAKQFNFDLGQVKKLVDKNVMGEVIKTIAITALAFFITVIPFLTSFKPFVGGVAVNCPPAALANSKHGLVVFEGVDKCQKSPIWMMLLLWGFFVYNGVRLAQGKIGKMDEATRRVLVVASLVCLGLIIFPEFFYFKDIYPMHFRSNTMFKLGYQAFIIMGLVSGYTITHAWAEGKKHKWYLTGLMPLLILVMIYPQFGINSYFRGLKTYEGIYGLGWINKQYPDNWAAIEWLNQTLTDGEHQVILEANGDSYTDYNMFSAFTGQPTVAGWTVHEWLWRGGYEPIANRGKDVRDIYESADVELTKTLLNQYQVHYIIISNLEREKYPQLNEEKLKTLARPVFTSGQTEILEVGRGG